MITRYSGRLRGQSPSYHPSNRKTAVYGSDLAGWLPTPGCRIMEFSHMTSAKSFCLSALPPPCDVPAQNLPNHNSLPWLFSYPLIVDVIYECPLELLSSEMRVIFQLMKISHFYEADDESVTQRVSRRRRLLLIVRLSVRVRPSLPPSAAAAQELLVSSSNKSKMPRRFYLACSAMGQPLLDSTEPSKHISWATATGRGTDDDWDLS